MTTPQEMPGASWESLHHDGRAFVRATLPDPPGQPGLPLTIAQPLAGRYQIDGLLAAGPFGVVLEATDLRTRNSVLVKALRPEAACVPPEVPDRAAVLAEELRRLRHALQTERRLLVRLRNAGSRVVPNPNDFVFDCNPALGDWPFAESEGGRALLDGSVVETEPYLVMERIAGVNLEAWLEREGRGGMEPGQAIGLIRPIVETLALLHEPWRTSRGRTWHCLYLDLKPSNILIDPTGRPVLLDFGGCQVVINGILVLEGGFTPVMLLRSATGRRGPCCRTRMSIRSGRRWLTF